MGNLQAGVLSTAMTVGSRYFKCDGLHAPYRSVLNVHIGGETMKCLALRDGWFMVIAGPRIGEQLGTIQ